MTALSVRLRRFLTLTLVAPFTLLVSGSTPATSTHPPLGVGDPFPTLEAERLSGAKVVFPEDVNAKANILILVFKQRAQRIVNTWADIILEELEPQSTITYHEVPMISTFYKPFSGGIDSGMRGGIPEQYHDNTTTFYGDRSPYFDKLGMDKKSSCYVFVLDKDGIIRYRYEGRRTDKAEQEFRSVISELIR